MSLDLAGLAAHLGFATAYTALGVALLVAGFAVLDRLTPGRLVQHIWTERSVNAAIVAAAGQLGLGAVVFTSIWTNGSAGIDAALVYTAAFGALGIALQAGTFRLLDALTPGSLAQLVCEVRFQPAAVLVAASQLAVCAIVVASIA